MEIRAATPDDAPGCAGVHVRGWQQTYGAHAPGVDALSPDDRLPRWREVLADPGEAQYLVLVDAGQVVGLVGVRPADDELALLYLDAGVHGSGWGGRLHDAGLDLLRGAGCRSALLWTLEGNTHARGFYAARGWAEDGRRQEVEIAGTPRVEVGYRRDL